jgi:hypothetical protein
MNKQEALQKLNESEDAVVTYIAANSKKQKYNVVTLNFQTPYIRKKRTSAVEDENSILVFSWDMDSFRILTPSSILSIVPLSKVLRNEAG